MSRPRIVRLLRIAFSAVCGILCLVLIALWGRSYYCADLLESKITDTSGIGAFSLRGGFACWVGRMPVEHKSAKVGFGMYYYRVRIKDWLPCVGLEFMHNSPAPTGLARFGVTAPYWLALLTTCTITALRWLPWCNRFSLRTLLIATTLVAVVLGLAVAIR